MKKYILGVIILLASVPFFTQNPAGFDKVVNEYIEGTVSLATPKQVKRVLGAAEITILDARETKEFNTSHIKGALNVGYDNFNLSSVKDLDKSIPVYVYCSIGYRSEKIGEQLQEAGFTKVYNLYGGIFNWANAGFPLVDANGNATINVHGYNGDWSKWLNEQKCSTVLN